jgi:glycosyltransferase involved in cell wall biosynthesis
LFSPKSVPKDPNPAVIFAGRITGDKGAGVLARAACQIAPEFPGLRVRFCGRGDEEFTKELRTMAAGAGFPELFEFPGFLDRQRLTEELSRSHVFALPSIHEPGPGLVYLEAMACGLPVIACEGAGAAEVVRDGINGILVPPNDVTAVANALRRLLSETDLRSRLSTGAREYVVREADSVMAVQKLEAFYVSVVEEAKARRP